MPQWVLVPLYIGIGVFLAGATFLLRPQWFYTWRDANLWRKRAGWDLEEYIIPFVLGSLLFWPLMYPVWLTAWGVLNICAGMMTHVEQRLERERWVQVEEKALRAEQARLLREAGVELDMTLTEEDDRWTRR